MERFEKFAARDLIFGLGLRWLVQTAGIAESRARALLAKWSKARGEGEVLEILNSAAKTKAGEPISYIERILNEKREPEPDMTEAKKMELCAWYVKHPNMGRMNPDIHTARRIKACIAAGLLTEQEVDAWG